MLEQMKEISTGKKQKHKARKQQKPVNIFKFAFPVLRTKGKNTKRGEWKTVIEKNFHIETKNRQKGYSMNNNIWKFWT